MAENYRNRWSEQDDDRRYGQRGEGRGEHRRRDGGARGNAYRINREDDYGRRYGRTSEISDPEWQQGYFDENRREQRYPYGGHGGYGGYAHPYGYGYGAAGGGYYGEDSGRGGYYSGESYGREGQYRGGRSDDRGMMDKASDEVASWFGDENAERRRQNDKRGRGPKDYKRSDERILEDVCDRLSDDPMVDASEVNVQVAEREVTLEGTVPSREERRRAEDCAESVSGVQHVQNNIRVKHSDDQRTNPLA